MDSWFPWLWARTRISNNYTNYEGWKYYFNSFVNDYNEYEKNENILDTIKPPKDLELFFI